MIDFGENKIILAPRVQTDYMEDFDHNALHEAIFNRNLNHQLGVEYDEKEEEEEVLEKEKAKKKSKSRGKKRIPTTEGLRFGRSNNEDEAGEEDGDIFIDYKLPSALRAQGKTEQYEGTAGFKVAYGHIKDPRERYKLARVAAAGEGRTNAITGRIGGRANAIGRSFGKIAKESLKDKPNPIKIGRERGRAKYHIENPDIDDKQYIIPLIDEDGGIDFMGVPRALKGEVNYERQTGARYAAVTDNKMKPKHRYTLARIAANASGRNTASEKARGNYSGANSEREFGEAAKNIARASLSGKKKDIGTAVRQGRKVQKKWDGDLDISTIYSDGSVDLKIRPRVARARKMPEVF